MNLWQQYIRPASISEALEQLSSAQPPVSVMAGGSDLMLDLKQGRHAPVHTLVDLSGIDEMKTICISGEELFIGAATPLSTIAASALVQQHAQALSEACNLIAGPQVRNVATLGGNVAHALPAADGTIALMALVTRVSVAGAGKTRIIPMGELFKGPGENTIENGKEILTSFHLPLCQPNQTSAFRRVMRAQGIALPILNMAIWVEKTNDMITQARVCAGPTGPTPRRLSRTESALVGSPCDLQTIDKALKVMLDEVSLRSSPHRASAEYRQHLAKVLFRDALQAAWQRAESWLPK